MAEIIASTYQIIRKIGAGGGGTVYLANHLRLGKQVVLKADKRKANTNPVLLRREVDVLKDLSNPYIPQVYDYFVENDTVYTVIDYIEGESLDRPLKRGERFSQPQVIHWARQLLEAVVYLHAPTHGTPPRGYVHSDIKPANLMCRPNGDICLIDFNIALALGEENVVGISAGYSSPEHYGYDFSMVGPTGSSSDSVTLSEETVLMPPSVARSLSGISFNSSQKRVIPDERSDIFSVGATLYHLLSGRRPAPNALEVLPLGPEDASKPVADIINKAMQPNPALRYQSAVEMLNAFEDLYQNDPRSQRLRRRTRITRIVLASVFLLGLLVGFSGLRLREAEQAEARVAAEQAEAEQRAARQEAEKREEAERLAREEEQRANQAMEYITASRESLKQGALDRAVEHACSALELHTVYDGQAQYALTDALGVYDLSTDFKTERLIELPASPFRVGLSPGGKRAFAIYQWNLAVFRTETGLLDMELPVEKTAFSSAVFLDDDRIVYSGKDGICCYDLAHGKALWSGEPATAIALSGDGSRIVSIYKDEGKANLYDTDSGEWIRSIDFGGRKQWVSANENYIDDGGGLLCLNETGTYLAVSFSDGSLLVFDTLNGKEKDIVFDPNDYLVFKGGFYQHYFVAYAKGGTHQPFFAVVDLSDRDKDFSGYQSELKTVHVDEHGILLASGNTLVRFYPETGDQTELAYTTEKTISAFCCSDQYTVVAVQKSFLFFDENATLLSRTETEDNCNFVFLYGATALIGSQDTPFLRILKLNQHQEAQLLKYNTEFVHREARLSSDEKTVMLFRPEAFQIYSIDGKLITEGLFPDDEQIYDQQFRRDEEGSYLEIFYYDGLIRRYSAKDGVLLFEEHGTPYDKSLEEDFYTDRFHIHTRPRQAPLVYDRETETLIGSLEKEDDITYITPIKNGFIAEYINTQGERYGLLMNNQLEILARLPMLCDVVDGKLIFDYPTGDLRYCPVYSLDELIAIAQDQA